MHPSIIVEDFVGKSYSDRMYQLLTGPINFPWSFNSLDVTYGSIPTESSKHTIGFYHNLLLDGQTTDFINLFVPLLDDIQDLVEQKCNFTRLRLSLHPKDKDAEDYNSPHTDYQDDHYSAIYYLNDSDGDTHMFNEYDDPNSGLTVLQRLNLARSKNTNYTIEKTVTPKKNKLFIFDGHQFHASAHPKESSFRIILNINFTTKNSIF